MTPKAATPTKRAKPNPKPRRIGPPRIFQYVDAVARHGSIRKAADSLHVVSSALNRRVLDLEEELGTPLFERLPRGVRPTAAGELFLTYVRRCIHELEIVGAQIEGLEGLLKGSVRIAASESVTGRLLPAAIARFHADHPGVGFHVWMDGPRGLTQALVNDTADLIITHDTVGHPDVSVLASVRQPLCALVAPSHPLAGKPTLRLRECVGFPVALPDETLAVRAMLDAAVAKASFKLEPALVSNSVEMTKTFARWNQAICFQFRIGRDEVPGLVEIPLSDPDFADARVTLAVRRRRVLPVAAAAFAHQLEETFEGL